MFWLKDESLEDSENLPDRRGHPDRILLRLNLNPGEGEPLLLRLNDARRPPIHVEEVVCEAVAGFQRKLPNGDTSPGADVAALASCTVQPASISAGSMFLRASFSGDSGNLARNHSSYCG